MKYSAAVLIVHFMASILVANSYAGGDSTPVITNPSGGGNEKPKPDSTNTSGDKASPEKGKEKR